MLIKIVNDLNYLILLFLTQTPDILSNRAVHFFTHLPVSKSKILGYWHSIHIFLFYLVFDYIQKI